VVFQKTIDKVKKSICKKNQILQSELNSGNFCSKTFLSENFEVARSSPSREKIEKLQICQNAPTYLKVGTAKRFFAEHFLNNILIVALEEILRSL
jgi:hypothetical protein